MYEQSITHKSLSALLRRSDYAGIPTALKAAHRNSLIGTALGIAATGFVVYPLKSWSLRGKAHFAPVDIATDLLLRNIALNLRSLLLRRAQGRNAIVSNLRHFIGEGVPYRVYRLDVKSFYESFSFECLLALISARTNLSPATRKLCAQLIENQKTAGHTGVPRGLAVSAIIAELAMAQFDQLISTQPAVFYYARFVDDIVMITSGDENKKEFFNFLEEKLPDGLRFTDEIKKKHIEEFKYISKRDSPAKRIEFDYLGYSFSARSTSSQDSKGGIRDISVSISSGKLARLKSRIVRAFLDFLKNHDERLLKDRIKLLTSNFSIYNTSSGLFNTAGIYFSYPHIDFPSKELVDLDQFLRRIILSKKGGAFEKIGKSLNARLRCSLLAHSFVRGYEEKVFCSFTGNRLKLLQKCWKY